MKSGAIATTLVPVKEVSLSDEETLRRESLIIVYSDGTYWNISGPGLNFITIKVKPETLFIVPDPERLVPRIYRIMNGYLVEYEERSGL